MNSFYICYQMLVLYGKIDFLYLDLKLFTCGIDLRLLSNLFQSSAPWILIESAPVFVLWLTFLRLDPCLVFKPWVLATKVSSPILFI